MRILDTRFCSFRPLIITSIFNIPPQYPSFPTSSAHPSLIDRFILINLTIFLNPLKRIHDDLIPLGWDYLINQKMVGYSELILFNYMRKKLRIWFIFRFYWWICLISLGEILEVTFFIILLFHYSSLFVF